MKIAPAHSTTWSPTSNAPSGRRVVPEFRHARRSDVERRADAERPPRRDVGHRRRTGPSSGRRAPPSCTTPARHVSGGYGELVGARHDRHGIGQIGAEQDFGPGRLARRGGRSAQQADGREPGAVLEHLQRRESTRAPTTGRADRRATPTSPSAMAIGASVVEFTPSNSGIDDVADRRAERADGRRAASMTTRSRRVPR